MIIIFHLVYVMATSLVNIIANSLFTNTNVRKLSDFTSDEQPSDRLQTSGDQCSPNYKTDVEKIKVLVVRDQLEPSQNDDETISHILGTKNEVTPYSSECISASYAGNNSVTTSDANGDLTEKPTISADSEVEYSDGNFRPIPPVYAQRYMAVRSVLMDEKWCGTIKKVIDFGCNDLAFFQYMKHMKGVEEILLVDIDEQLLRQFSCRVAPLNCDYLGIRQSPLLVQIFGGSIAEQDNRLVGTDAVVCIELIEHLWPQEVEAVPYTVFGFIAPRVAIFTTPNADFNVVFKNFPGFRHPDHKFEWTREQFECWGNNLIARYPDYEVTYHGIGAGGPGTEDYGCCSQMAVFVKKSTTTPREEIKIGDVYKLIQDYNYPYKVDNRTNEMKILHEAEYYLYAYSTYEIHQMDDGTIEIPLSVLFPHVESWCDSLDKLRSLLEGAEWKITDRDPESTAVIFPLYDGSCEDDMEEAIDQQEESQQLINFDSKESVCEGSFLHSGEDWDACELPSSDRLETQRSDVNGCYKKLSSVASSRETFDCNLGIVNHGEITTSKGLINGHSPSKKPLLSSNLTNSTISKPVTNFTMAKSSKCPQVKEDAVRDNSCEQGSTVNNVNCSVSRTEPVQVGVLFQSPTISMVNDCDSSVAMSGTSVKSLDDATIKMVAETSNFIANSLQRSGSRNRLGHRVASEESHITSTGNVNRPRDQSSRSDLPSSSSLALEDTSPSSTTSLISLFSPEQESLYGFGRPDSLGSEVPTREQRMDLDQSPDVEDLELDDSDSDDSLSEHSQDGLAVDNRALPRRVQPHRNHFPFGLNDVVVENGDVANNNRDGEGNNAVPFAELEEDDDLPFGEVGDHEEEEEDDEDFDLDNANDPILPINANPFPHWLLRLLEVANEDLVELGAAGEPSIFLEDV